MLFEKPSVNQSVEYKRNHVHRQLVRTQEQLFANAFVCLQPLKSSLLSRLSGTQHCSPWCRFYSTLNWLGLYNKNAKILFLVGLCALASTSALTGEAWVSCSSSSCNCRVWIMPAKQHLCTCSRTIGWLSISRRSTPLQRWVLNDPPTPVHKVCCHGTT